jgi:S1-C subfamily serine protease
LLRVVGGLNIGQTIPMSIIRDGHEMELSLTVLAQPSNYATTQPVSRRGRGNQNVETISVPRAGVDLADLTEERAQALGIDRKAGAIIMNVEPGGPVSEVGLSRGSVIVKVDNKTITTAEEAKAALEAANIAKGALVQAITREEGTANVGTSIVIVKVQK